MGEEGGGGGEEGEELCEVATSDWPKFAGIKQRNIEEAETRRKRR
jgi:hypothetical protein